ncbi:hypothetical protein G6L15_16250 [Agrobacterium rhizogenes]|jgi:lysophospholipase L1-like esterase|uniref:hypothetical protein n=1 Tax=Rhizobium rhizogenes TaxID=359 RepID=UPI00157249B8|nr:hypothetical protein [Rhizobium rhizogenes]NTG87704.1 hypothetical protein [Rhizobium rhizogenes]
MISEAHARAVIQGLQDLKAKGVMADWIDPKIAEYQEYLARAMLLNGQPEPEFVPYQDANGDWVINKWGDRDNDI